jgi:hypothetical protein
MAGPHDVRRGLRAPWQPGRTRPAGLSRSSLGWSQVRRWPRRSLALWLCLTTTVALGGTLPLAGAAANQTALATSLARSGSLVVEREVSGPDAFKASWRAVDDQVRTTLGDRLRPEAAYGRLGPLELTSVNGHQRSARSGRPYLEARWFGKPSAAGAADEVGGQDASGEAPAVSMTQTDARRLGLSVGDSLCLKLAINGSTWCAQLASLRDPRGEDLADLDPGTAKLGIPLAELFRLAPQAPRGTLMAGLAYRLDPARATGVPPGWLARKIEGLATALNAAGYRVLSSPAATLAQLEVEQRATSAWLRTLTTLVVLEGLVASLGVANHLLAGWRGEATILRARGWGWRHLWLVEASALGWILVCAATTALALGGALSRATAGFLQPHLDAYSTLLTEPPGLLVSLAGALAVTSALDALKIPAHPRSSSSHPGPRGHLRLVTALFGLPGIAALAGGSAITTGPWWRSLAPTIGALLVGVAITSPPRPLWNSECDPAAMLARGQARNRPTQHLAATLLLTLAAATIVFAVPTVAGARGPSNPEARPLSIGVAAACLGAATLAWVGLAVHFRHASDRRRHEYQGLTAHGLGERQIRRSLALERRGTWWSGLGGGSLLGIALQAWHLPRPIAPSWTAVGLTSVALCALAAGSVGSVLLADRSPRESQPAS